MRGSYSMVFWVGVLACMGVVGACGPKEEAREPRRTATEPPPPVHTGPPQKLMPPELRVRVNAVFRTQKAELERCYNDHVVKINNPKLRGEIIIAVKIGYTAQPTKVWFLKNTFTSRALTNCFSKTVQKWEFPTWGGVMNYSFQKISFEEM